MPNPLELLSADAQQALAYLKSFQQSSGVFDFDSIKEARISKIKELRVLKQNFSTQQDRWLAGLHPTVRSVIGHVQVPLLNKLAADFSFPDMGIIAQYSAGHPVVGEVPYGGHLTPRESVAEASVADLASTARTRQKAVQDRVMRWGSVMMRRNPEVVHAGFRKTMAEVAAGTMSQPYDTLDEVAFALGCDPDTVCLTARETIEQMHHSEHGMVAKKRNIDDLKHGGQNGTVSLHETYVPKNINDLAVWHKVLRLLFGEELLALWGTDFEGWYRQHANRPDDHPFTVLCFYDPERNCLRYAIAYGTSFGSKSAPLNCSRLLRALTFLAARLFGIFSLDCVDDVNACEPKKIAPSALVTWKAFAGEILGFRFEGSKHGLGTSLVIQGILVDVADFELKLSIAPSRAVSLTQELDATLSSARLPPGKARKLGGKLSNASTCLAGKNGRAFVKPVHMRGALPFFRCDLTADLRTSLLWWRDTLALLKYPRIVPASAKRVIISFSDGEGTARVAGALWCDHGVYSTRGFAPDFVPQIYPDSEAPASQINSIEAFGPLFLLSTFEELFSDSLWIHFIDNSSALGSLVKGHSTGHALSSIAATFWSLATRVRTYPWFLYVPSDLNVIDGYSRGDPFTNDPLGNAVSFRPPKLPAGWPAVELDGRDEH